MSGWAWALALAVVLLAASEVVRRVLKRRLQREEAALQREEAAGEAAFEREFSARVDEEYPRLLDEESE